MNIYVKSIIGLLIAFATLYLLKLMIGFHTEPLVYIMIFALLTLNLYTTETNKKKKS